MTDDRYTDRCCLDTKSCLILFFDHMDCSSQVPGIFQAQEYWSRLHFLLQGIFPTQESNPYLLLHCQVGSLPLSHQGSPDRQIK